MPGTKAGGFAKMDPKRQRQIASDGGIAAHRAGTAHQWTREEAAAAGRKGGKATGAVRKREREEHGGAIRDHEPRTHSGGDE